ncbi:MAG TPA: hypothetical protein VFW34_11145 [Candidatus Rubrimentiphilum sp.]|nr:hypothetical protein [Candidatus Rubrimentiphilum sp.]
MRPTAWYALAALVTIVVLIVGAFVVSSVIRPPTVVAVGTPIQHDDFFFTVTAIDRRTLADGTAHYRVSVRVQNQAKAVGYRWRDGIAYVRAFDSRGFGRNFLPVTHGSFVLAAGQERTAKLAFEIPPGYSSANLRFWDGAFMGDAFNGAAYGKAIVPLEAYHPPFGT